MSSALIAAPHPTAVEWFADWFDSPHYHRLYASRDEAEAAAFIDGLVARLRPDPGAEALDLGCGAGRHARRLAARGLRVTGLDLSAGSIRQARAFETPGLRFRRHDMRRPFGRERFDYVFSVFTSFGYFDSAAEHVTVMRNVARALRPGGILVLDYLNHLPAARSLVRDESRAIDGTAYHLTRWADACAFYKRIRIDEGDGRMLEFVERVARFGLDDFRRLCARAGLLIEDTFGDYGLAAYDAETSPRLILVARKVEPARIGAAAVPVASGCQTSFRLRV
jgi:SAM-dependent methyltransferase